jgi:predicted AAA+ superfamily ATPase
LGITSRSDYSTHYLKGGLFEAFVISEINKYLFNHKLNGQVSFFRDSNGNEVDVIIELNGKIKAIEIKSGKTINQDFFKGLIYWNNLMPDSATDKYLVYGGDQVQIRTIAKVLGWQHIRNIFKKAGE